MRWEKVRMKGMKYVVLRAAIISTIFFFVALNIISWFWNGRSLPSEFFFIYPALGLVAGFANWWMNEARFQTFLMDKKIRAGLKR